jgi:peptide/nickel transport system substrate-binding protein
MGMSLTDRSRLATLCAALVVCLLAVSCGNDSSSAGPGQSGATSQTTTTALAPRVGGTLTFAEYSEPAGLDPIVSTGSGTTGGIEMAAIYDTLMRYEPVTGQYEPRLALSLTSNADFTEWTVKLRPNVKFTDGTDYDAAAVAFAWNRHRSGTAGAPPCAESWSCPRNNASSNVYMALIKDLQVVDPLTLKATLKESWASFAWVLASEPSMVPSPTALKQCDPTKNANQCAFNVKPIGAGPFMVESFKPKEGISLVRNPTYWGGQVPLDAVRFVNLGDVGGQKSYDALKAGSVNAAFLRQPDVVANAHDDKLPGVSTLQAAGSGYLLNTGVTVTCAGGAPAPTCVGRPDGPTQTSPPTKDLKVRQAIAAAIDPKVISQRASASKGYPGSDLLQKTFRWYPNVPGPTYDPESAKKLVIEAKAAGWDGKLRILENNTPARTAAGLAVQTMLQAVGIEVALDTSKDSAGQIAQVTSARDFDMAGWGFALASDDGAMWALAQNFSSTSNTNRVGYKNAAVDKALKSLLVAKSDAEKRALFEEITKALAADVPFLPWATVEEYVAHSPKVHGIVGTNKGTVLLHQAWIEP